eukprot:3665805-Rhodomonas_salina.1
MGSLYGNSSSHQVDQLSLSPPDSSLQHHRPRPAPKQILPRQHPPTVFRVHCRMSITHVGSAAARSASQRWASADTEAGRSPPALRDAMSGADTAS